MIAYPTLFDNALWIPISRPELRKPQKAYHQIKKNHIIAFYNIIKDLVDSVAEKAFISLQLKIPRLRLLRTSISSLSERIGQMETYLCFPPTETLSFMERKEIAFLTKPI